MQQYINKETAIGTICKDIKSKYVHSKCKCNDFDFDNCTIEHLGTFMASTKRQCEAIEGSFIQDYHKFEQYDILDFSYENMSRFIQIIFITI